MPPVCKPDSFGLRPSVPSSTILGATQCYRQLVSPKMDLCRSPLHMLASSPGTFPRQRVKDVPRKRKPQSEHQKGSPLGHCPSECLTLHDARVYKRKNSSEVKLMMRTFLYAGHGLVFRGLSYAFSVLMESPRSAAVEQISQTSRDHRSI